MKARSHETWLSATTLAYKAETEGIRAGGVKVMLFEPIFMILYFVIYSRALPHSVECVMSVRYIVGGVRKFFSGCWDFISFPF